ncbi:hypothetical protein [Sodalis-like endosymbiont of Proechinophthirus fluctus]|nr:hypothetical protein [Sodalis-like endosymbiont of Proechinophthirus fluctus]
MQLSVQQRAAQRNFSYVLAAKLNQRILAGEFTTAGDIFCPVK